MYWTRAEEEVSNKNKVMKKVSISVEVKIKLNILNSEMTVSIFKLLKSRVVLWLEHDKWTV